MKKPTSPPRRRLADLLRFGKPKTPGFGISKDFYLCVMASKAQLPTPAQIANPTGEGGAVEGYIAPLDPNAPDDALERPLERGSYAVSDLEKKSLLLLLARPREESAFDPRKFAASEDAQGLPEELRLRLAANWWILQLAFQSHDPMVYPALRLLLKVAARLGHLTDGAIADPQAAAYRFPSELEPADDGLPIHADQFVQLGVAAEPDSNTVYTLGMRKFVLPEFQIADVPDSMVGPAMQVLLALCQLVLTEGPVQVGHTIGSRKLPFTVAEGGVGPVGIEGVSTYELIPPRNHTVAECILAALARE